MIISAKVGRLNKVHISIDGEYKFTVDSEYWYSTPYCHMEEIDDNDGELCDKFLTDIGSRYAFISGLRILSYGDNSCKELRIKLISKGHNPQYVDLSIDKLEEHGYIDDVRYAENKAEFLYSKKLMNKTAIKSELLRKGVDSQVIDSVLVELEIDPQEALNQLLTTKYRRYLDNEKGRNKTVAALRRLGYSWSDIKKAMADFIPEKEDCFYD